jgi:hypothetical protein
MNGGAPEASLPNFSDDVAALSTHVRDYFLTFGVPACQVSAVNAASGSNGTIIHLERAADGIKVAESLAYARFDSDDESTNEGFYWPTLPEHTMASARALLAMTADPAALGAYKAKLPPDARGDGSVVIHHSSFADSAPFESRATYDVFGSASYSFDGEGILLDRVGPR